MMKVVPLTSREPVLVRKRKADPAFWIRGFLYELVCYGLVFDDGNDCGRGPSVLPDT
jgi:hypothetical protein